MRSPRRIPKRVHTTRTVIRVHIDKDYHADYAVPHRSDMRWLETIPGLRPGMSYQYFKQTICIDNGNIITGKLVPFSGQHHYTKHAN